MAELDSAEVPDNASDHLARLLTGLPVTECRLDLGGISTAVLEGWSGSPIVLLHGLGGYAAEWSLVIPRLAGRHRVVVPDLPGLGRSHLPPARLDTASVVSWLRQLIERTCVRVPTRHP